MALPRLTLFLASLVLAFGIEAVASTTIYNLDQTSGWSGCSGCTNSLGLAQYSMTQHISSPSLDGNATKFHLGGTQPLADALWHREVVGSSSPTHFQLDLRYYYTNPSAPTGMEFSTGEHVGHQWYRLDWQCSFYFHVWRVWDGKNGGWINTSAPCARPTAYTWTHLVLEGHRYNGKTYFDAVTTNGHKYYVNRSVYPASTSSSANLVSIHFQLNGNKTATDFDVWGDRFQLTYW